MKNSYQIRFYVGTEYDKDNQTLSSEKRAAAKSAALDIINLEYSGCTVYDGRGVWRDNSGYSVFEGCLVFEVITDCADNAERVGGMIRAEYAQCSVLVTIATVTSLVSLA